MNLHYRQSTLGKTLMQSLMEIHSERQIDKAAAFAIMAEFDAAVPEVLAAQGEEIKISGGWDTYNHTGSVFRATVKDALFSQFRAPQPNCRADFVKLYAVETIPADAQAAASRTRKRKTRD
eukprot:TRINITY_DN16428_c0_g1_i1.p2 TRINITY_DN16428_c0_g1~~TRINITY_DN16428_c0_g1_i1.p2  ORF type:complete len:121 (+),score=31.91 TRINITY_DN16428_c0_g1_i1:3-365(+)